MTPTESLQTKSFNTVVVGNGPAAIGIFVAAARAGRLQELLNRGVAVVGNTPSIGSGKLGEYKIRSNSPGGDFLEPFEASIDRCFEEALAGENAQELRRNEDQILPLNAIGRFIDCVGRRVHELLEQHPACVYLHEAAGAVQTQPDGSIRVITDKHILSAQSVVLATGGRPKAKDANGTINADAYLRNPNEVHNTLEDAAEIRVIGSSHSAFSVAHTLLQHSAENGINIRVRIQHRSPIRLFYDLQKETPPEWYGYSAEDVCPKTNRLHRFGGLRGDARQLYLRIQAGEETRVLFESGNSAENSFTGATIDATGYETNLLPLIDHDGKPISLALSEDGQTNVNAYGGVKASDQEVVPNIYGIGLGYGIRPNGIGEPRFNGRLDGVNVYWGPVGEAITQSILDRRSKCTEVLSSPQES
jgi:hypothetical protein